MKSLYGELLVQPPQSKRGRKRKNDEGQTATTSTSADNVQPDHTNQAIVVEEGTWVAVAYENGWYPGLIMNIQSGDDGSMQYKLDFLHPANTKGKFRVPSPADVSTVAALFIFAVFESPPVPVSGGGLYKLENVQTDVDKYQASAMEVELVEFNETEINSYYMSCSTRVYNRL